MTDIPYFQTCLRSELEARCQKNPRYSIRAFARAMDLNPGALSWILAGKRAPSFKIAQKILNSLALTPDQKERFLSSLANTQCSRGLKRMHPAFRKYIGKKPVLPAPKEISHEHFRVIADWYHYAILELTYVEDFSSDPKWIAHALGIHQGEARAAVDRLLALGMLEVREGVLRKTETFITTADKTTTAPALRRHQKQILEKAIHSLENDPIDERSVTSGTMAIDPTRLPEAKQMIEKFMIRLCQFLEGGERKRVYELGLSLYPVQKSGVSQT